MLKNKKGFSVVGLLVVLIVLLAVGLGIYRMSSGSKALKMKDLEDMYLPITRSPIEYGWAISPTDYRQTIDFFGQLFDNSNDYLDNPAAKKALKVCLMIDQDRSEDYAEIDIQAGDRVELTYDGGRTVSVYLPRITPDDLTLTEVGLYGIRLYVAADGSTYYDEKFTQLAQAAQ
jgi:hypothetical protein